LATIKRNAAYSLALSVSQVLYPLVVYPHVSRVLGPEGMGSIGFVESFQQYFVMLAALGVPIYGVREIARVSQDTQSRSRVFSEIAVIHLVSTLVVSVLYMGLYLTVDRLSGYRELFLISTGILYLQVFTVEWLFQGLEQFRVVAIRGILSKILAVVAIFVFVRDVGDVAAYYGITLGVTLFSVVINLSYARSWVTLRLNGVTLRPHLKPMFYLLSFGLVTQVYTVLDTVILGFLRNEAEVGFYVLPVRLIRVIITVLTAVILVTVPRLSGYFKEGKIGEAKSLLGTSFGFLALTTLPVAVGLFLYAPEIIGIFAGGSFLPSVLALRCMAVNVLIIGLSHVFGVQVLNTANRERDFLKAALCGMVVSLLANFILIPIWGYVGASVASFLAEATVLICLIRYAGRVIDFGPDWRLLGQALICTSSFIPLNLLLHASGLGAVPVLCIGVAVSALSYVCLQYYIFRNATVLQLWQNWRNRTF